MAGRKKASIDWAKVDRLLEAGCMGTEVAAALGVHPNTLYERCTKDQKCDFSDYSAAKRASGDTLLRAAQFKKAMSGDATMQIWLGKNRLGQRNEPITTQGDEAAQRILEMVDLLAKLRGQTEP
jgi:hypothetical protein